MKISALLYFLKFGLKTVLLKKQNPLIGVVIVTDRCNLNCRHCSVHNIRSVCYPYDQIVQAMTALYNQGVRVLIFCGGEPCLWQDGEKSLSHLIQKGKSLGFFYINVVTNGTLPLNLPDVDLIMISLDGDREHHNAIRGDTYDTIMNISAQHPGLISVSIWPLIASIKQPSPPSVNLHRHCRILKQCRLIFTHPIPTPSI